MSEAILRRLMKKVRVNEQTECWEWSGTKSKSGYGMMKVCGKPRRVHRLMFAAKNGGIPDGIRVCHRCDNPPCCNPDHLFLGSDADNMADRDAKGRTARGDRHGARIHYAEFADRCKRRAVEQPDTYCRGERNGRAKLSAAQVSEIRSRYAAGGMSQKKLARQFGVVKSTIGRIIRNNGWDI